MDHKVIETQDLTVYYGVHRGMLAMFLAAFCSKRRITSMIAGAVLAVSYFFSL